ncbi:hypothetical protein GWN91_05210, partial [Candidatus Saccharibacteria bacterium]|nr:hypothetical protein [Candidatus Saccharibacteria bacterium]NIV72368.1 hypothetical protein [Calditrichia bacterium]NIW79688.1 hypothetical protein [Calditrichia bacterium]
DTSQFFTAQNEKLGLGSSAALTVALFSALSKFQDNNFDIEKEHDVIFKTSLEIHRKAQDSVGSGIDITASVFGGVLRYHITDRENKTLPIYEKLTIPDDLHILSIWTGASASTAQFVQKVNEFKMIKPYDYEAITERMKQVSTSGIEAIQQNSLTEFLKSVRLYYDEMKTLGEKSGVPIVSKAHHHIHDLVMGEGGAYKPSGAGGGDIGTAFCSAATIKEKIAQKLIQNGFHAIDLELVKKGVQLRNF